MPFGQQLSIYLTCIKIILFNITIYSNLHVQYNKKQNNVTQKATLKIIYQIPFSLL